VDRAIALLVVRMAHANRRTGGPFFEIAAVEDLVLDLFLREAASNDAGSV